MNFPYPQSSRERDHWILAQRANAGGRRGLDPWRPYAFLLENELSECGEVLPVATIFLTNRECPLRCLMCDLWQNTLTQSVPTGAIPEQIDYALARLPPARQVKLYNSGSFFDQKAIPPEDYDAIAGRLRQFDRVIVECHPALVGQGCLEFRYLLETQLEVAMGLETVHPEVLPLLNKRMTLTQFSDAAAFLRRNNLALRVFILVKPPFLNEQEAIFWAERSLEFAFDCGANVAVVIPTRPGNGALEALADQGHFSPPSLQTLEAVTEYGVKLKRGRVFADLWDLKQFADCAPCLPLRTARLNEMNLRQEITAPILCDNCGVKD